MKFILRTGKKECNSNSWSTKYPWSWSWRAGYADNVSCSWGMRYPGANQWDGSRYCDGSISWSNSQFFSRDRTG